MSSYKFPLETLLNYRSAVAEKKMESLAIQESKRRAIVNRLALIQTEYKVCRDSEHSDKVDLGLLNQQMLHLDLLSKRANEQSLALEKAEKRVRKHREELVQAMKEKQMLEKLKDKKEHRHRMELSKLEAKELDEIALIRPAKRK